MDDLSNNKEVRRWPEIDRHLRLSDNGGFEVTSAFGGLVFLESFKGGSLSIQISNIIPTPTLGDGDNLGYVEQLHDEPIQGVVVVVPDGDHGTRDTDLDIEDDQNGA